MGKIRRYKHLVGGITPAPLQVLMFALGDNTITYTSTDPSFVEMMEVFLGVMNKVPGMKGATIERITVPIR